MEIFNKKLIIGCVASFLITVITGCALLFSIGDIEFLGNNKNLTEYFGYSDGEQTPQTDKINGSFEAGIKRRQEIFESKGPEYPNEEKIVYDIDSEGNSTPQMHPADFELWNMVKSLSPTDEILDSISRFEVYYDEVDDTYASVESLGDENEIWLYSINYIAVDNFEELVPTIIHEYAHILALSDEQTITEAEDANIYSTCKNYLVAEGCLEDDAYLDVYFENFWANDSAYNNNGEDNSEDESIRIFESRSNDFVTEYSVTNPVEDFAESFMFYVTKETLTQSTLKYDKVSFFDNHPELVSYKLRVQDTINSWEDL